MVRRLGGRSYGWCGIAAVAATSVTLLAGAGGAAAEQASSARRAFQHGLLDGGFVQTCAVLTIGTVRCWGSGAFGQLGYNGTQNVGDDEHPAERGPVKLGGSVHAVTAGGRFTCALRHTGDVYCWGENFDGQLGYRDTEDIGDDEDPVSVGGVRLGARAVAITAGSGAHTCALLELGTVRCWGLNSKGQLGLNGTAPVGDDEHPNDVASVQLGTGRTARAITAGAAHTCALLDTWWVRCWGDGSSGRLGYKSVENVGDTEHPSARGPVELGTGRTARAIAAGGGFTCAILDTGDVRCWGEGGSGRLGTGDTEDVGDDEHPSDVPPVRIGAGRTAQAIAAGREHACALLDDGNVRCWGDNTYGQLGIKGIEDIGDGEHPSAAGPVQLGAGRKARAIATGDYHTCALLDNGAVRCWGWNDSGQLGYRSFERIGDTEHPSEAGPVNLGGLLFGGVGNIALALRADDATPRVGQVVRVTATATGGGIDPSGPLRVGLPAPAALRRIGGAYPLALGPVAPGASTQATRALRVRRPGNHRLTGTLFDDGAAFFDVGFANNSASLTLAATKAAPTLTLNVRPTQDTTLPIEARLSGRLKHPSGIPLADACTGQVRVVLRRGDEIVFGRRAALRRDDGRCVYSKRARFNDRDALGGAERLRARARFLGNALLRAKTSSRRELRVR